MAVVAIQSVTAATARAGVTTSVAYSTTALDVSPTAIGAEISNTGTLIEANHFGGGGEAPLTLDNGLTFGTSISSLINPFGGFNAPWENPSGTIESGWLHNSADYRGYVITNSAYSDLLNHVWWIAYTASISDLEISGLTIGKTYRLQLISPDPAGGTVTVEGSTPYRWLGNDQVLSAIWTAQDSTLNMRLARWAPDHPNSDDGQGGEVYINGYALHEIPATVPEPSTLAIFSAGICLTGLNVRRRRK